jgi:hypothetical protein
MLTYYGINWVKNNYTVLGECRAYHLSVGAWEMGLSIPIIRPNREPLLDGHISTSPWLLA